MAANSGDIGGASDDMGMAGGGMGRPVSGVGTCSRLGLSLGLRTNIGELGDARRGCVLNDLMVIFLNGYLEILGGQCLSAFGREIVIYLGGQACGVGVQHILGDLVVTLGETVEYDLLDASLYLVLTWT